MKFKIEDFSAGINSLTHPTKLGNAEFPVYENYITKAFGDKGAGVKRNGFSARTAAWDSASLLTLYEASFGSGAKLLGNTNGANTALYYSADPYTSAGTLINKNARWNSRIQYAMLKDKVYISNLNASANWYYDSTTAAEMGCIPCDNTVITLAHGAGGDLSLGNYYYAVTFIYDGFQESGAILWDGFGVSLAGWNPAIAVNANDKVTFSSIPVGGSRVTARKIYRSKVNDATVYYELTTIADNTTTSFVDTQADSTLGTQIDPFLLTQLKKPYIAKYQCVHKDRLIHAGLTDNFYTALSNSDITITNSFSPGALVGGATYTWRFFKCWIDNASGFTQLRYSEPLDVTFTLSALSSAVNITYNGSDSWYKLIAYSRTSAGGTDFKYPTLLSFRGVRVSLLTAGVIDGVADGSRFSSNFPTSIANGSLTYNSWVTFSDPSCPDLFTATNIEKIGQDNGDHITGIFSDEDRIIVTKQKDVYAIDTRALDSTFWYANKIISGVGSDDYSCKQIKGGYIFKTTRTIAGLGTLDVVYIWDGRSSPVPIGDKLLNYAKSIINSAINFKDLSYDASNEWIWLIYSSDRSNPGTTYFIYDLNEGKWMAWFNDTASFSSSCITDTKSYGVLIGDDYGTVNNYSATAFQDTINTTARDFTAGIKTRTYEIPDADILIRNGCIDCECGANFTSVNLKYSVDGGAEQTMNLTGTANAFNRLKTLNHPFTSANDKSYRQVYFRITEQSNGSFKLLNFVMDLVPQHEGSMGR